MKKVENKRDFQKANVDDSNNLFIDTDLNSAIIAY